MRAKLGTSEILSIYGKYVHFYQEWSMPLTVSKRHIEDKFMQNIEDPTFTYNFLGMGGQQSRFVGRRYADNFILVAPPGIQRMNGSSSILTVDEGVLRVKNVPSVIDLCTGIFAATISILLTTVGCSVILYDLVVSEPIDTFAISIGAFGTFALFIVYLVHFRDPLKSRQEGASSLERDIRKFVLETQRP